MTSRDLADRGDQAISISPTIRTSPRMPARTRSMRLLNSLGLAKGSAKSRGREGRRHLRRASLGIPARQVERDRRQLHVRRRQPRRQGRQQARRRLHQLAARGEARADQGRHRLAQRPDRRAAPESGRGRRRRRAVPVERGPVRRHQQHHAQRPAAIRAQQPGHPRQGAKIRGRGPRPADQEDASRQGRHRRHAGSAEVRADHAAHRSARPGAAPVGRAVGDAVAVASAHQAAHLRACRC